MKKRLLSALLALALVFVLLPTTALAGVTTKSDYDISINGTGWKFERDNTSGAYIPAYYYHTNEFSADENYRKLYTNDNLMLTKEGNTVTITIRRGTSHDYRVYPIEFTLEKKSTTSGSPYDYTPCIEMGNNNNLVITGKGTLNITRDEKNGIGAALCSEVGDITITDGITVKANFLKQVSNSTVGNAISVKDHNLIISGKNTKVEARNSSCNFQDLYDVSATVCVENGEIKVSDGATLSAINNFTNSYTSQYSYYSRAISGSSSKPCALTVTGENSCVIAETDNSLGKAYGYVNFSIDGAKIEVGTSSPAQTITDINNIKDHKYAKISVPALEKDSYVYIAGGPAVVGQWTTITADSCSGSYYYNADKKELTLKDITITRNNNNNVNHAIQFTKNGDYTINLEGTNNISSVANGICALNKAFYDDPANISVTISGSGSLNVIANTYAIDMQVGNLIFNNTGNITLATNTNYQVQSTVCNALRVKSGSITIDNTKYDIEGKKQAKDFPIEDIGSSPALETILKGTSTDKDLYFKSITIAPKSSETYYNGTAMKYGETRNAGSGTISCDENGAITLNGATEGTLEFRSSADSTLVLEGTNTLSSIVTTQKGLTISVSGSGSLTVGSIRVPNNTQHTANLTITGGAHVTVNRPSGEDEPAVEVSGNLTVTGEGTQLSAECTAATNPAIEVGGNVTISGNPGTNAYTVKAYNKYAIQRGRDDKLRPSQMPSAIEISGDSLSISGSAQVMAKTDSDGAAVWMPAQKVISVADASLIAQNRSHNFSTISFGDESNMGNIYAKGQVNIVAENMLGSNSSLAHRAIKAFIYNHYNTGDSNPYYIKVVSEGVQSGGNVNVIPGDCTSTGGYKVTITRGDAYVAPTKTITEIIVTGLTPPVKGATPVDKSKVTLTDGLTVESITWGPALTSDGKFAANTAYTAHINYSVKAGYELAANANCPQVAGANVTRWHQEGMPQDEIEVTFPKTAADTPTEKPTITLDLPAPVAGVAPVTTGVTATSSDNTPLTIDKVEWYAYTVEYNNGKFERIVEGDKVSGNFEANTYYFAEITFDRSIYFANEGLNIIAPTWPLEGSWPESRIYRVIENSYTARILFPATDAACNHQPGDWQDGTDGEHHVKVCAICHNVVATESHAFGGYQINTNNSHTRVCSVCNAAYTNAHEFNSYAHNENSHWKVCVCGATTSYANHEFDPATGACACGATQSGGNPTPDVPAAPTGLAGVAPLLQIAKMVRLLAPLPQWSMLLNPMVPIGLSAVEMRLQVFLLAPTIMCAISGLLISPQALLRQ